MKRLKGKIALVTSSTRGIGLACAKKLASEGAIVYMGVRRLETTQEICDTCKKDGLIMKPVFFDAAFDFDFSNAFKSLVRAWGTVNGAGKKGNNLYYELNKIDYSVNKIRRFLSEKCRFLFCTSRCWHKYIFKIQ